MVYLMLLIIPWLPKCFLVRHILGLHFWKAEICTTNLYVMTSPFICRGKEADCSISNLTQPCLSLVSCVAEIHWPTSVSVGLLKAESSILAGNEDSAIQKRMFPESQPMSEFQKPTVMQ